MNLLKEYGRGQVNLTFTDDYVIYRSHQLILGEEMQVIKGRYFVSDQVEYFEPDLRGPHKLVIHNWGGANNSSRGGKLPRAIDNPAVLRCCRSTSIKGGMGCDSIVVPVNYKFSEI